MVEAIRGLQRYEDKNLLGGHILALLEQYDAAEVR